jgi:hypothetical protein
MKVRVAPLLAMFKEGIYPAVVERPEAQTGSYGEYLRWSFMVYTPKGEAISVSGLTSTIFNPRSKLYGWVAAITGRTYRVNEELDTDALHGKRCKVYLTVRELDGGGSINQVEKVLSPDEPVTTPNHPNDDINPFDENDDIPF